MVYRMLHRVHSGPQRYLHIKCEKEELVILRCSKISYSHTMSGILAIVHANDLSEEGPQCAIASAEWAVGCFSK